MFRKITNALVASVLALTISTASFAVPPTPKQNNKSNTEGSAGVSIEVPKEKVLVTPFIGFNYRTLAVGDELESYLDETRNKFDPAMPGFAAFLQVGKQLPTISAGVDISIPVRLLPRDTLEIRILTDLSSSSLFGESKDEKTFPAHVRETIDLGDTPTTWTQHLTFYGAFGGGALYSPTSWVNEAIKPYVEVTAGVSYINSKSTLHIHMNGSDFTKFMIDKGGVELLNKMDIYTDILGEAKTTGVGWFVAPVLGISFDINNFIIKLGVGYRVEYMPYMKIAEHTVSDSKVEDKVTYVSYNASGLDARILLGYKF